MKQSDRRYHLYVIGRTGTGKTSLLETLAQGDILAGRRLGLIDPHGDLAERLAAFAKAVRPKDLMLLDAADADCPLRFNPLAQVAAERRPLMASGLIDAFRMLWQDAWGSRLEYILRNALLVLLEQPAATLADVGRLLTDRAFRKQAAGNTSNDHVRSFWLSEYQDYSYRYKMEAIAPIQNKIGAFLADPALSRLLVSPGPTLDLRRLIDSRCIFIANLAKGRIGSGASGLLGALLVSMLGLAALSRADQPEEKRRDFHLYLDEFQTFTTPTLASMLSELRKYRLSLVLAHQYMTQLEPEVRDAILGNAGTIVSFRLGLPDAERLAAEFHPVFSPTDIVNLPNYHIYLKLMIDGAVSKPFSAVTIKPAKP